MTYLDGRDAGEPVFAVPEKTALMFRTDLRQALARWIMAVQHRKDRRQRLNSEFLVYRGTDGKVADFHSLRHAYVTNLVASGAAPKDAQTLARHSDCRLTLDRYTHVVRGGLAAAVERLPTLDSPKPNTGSERLRATGTYGGEKSVSDLCQSTVRNRVSKTELGRIGAKGVTRRKTAKTPEKTLDSEGFSSLRRAGFEPATFGSVDRCSIQLS